MFDLPQIHVDIMYKMSHIHAKQTTDTDKGTLEDAVIKPKNRLKINRICTRVHRPGQQGAL